jgi:CRISPR-associated protein Cas5d
MQRSRTFSVKVWGDLALYTDPFFRGERMTYSVPTPSGARGALDAILRKAPMRWQVESIGVLNPIQHISFVRNEVKDTASASSKGIVIEDRRTQRNTVALSKVAYVFTAHFEYDQSKALRPDDSVTKYEEMFLRRVSKGQVFHRPYLGCREFPAFFCLAKGDEVPLPLTRPLGRMFYDYDYSCRPSPKALFFVARLDHGVVHVPSWQEVLQGGAK